MPPRPTRTSRHRIEYDTVLFAVVLLLVSTGVGLLAAYEHGYFENAGQQSRLAYSDAGNESAVGLRPDAAGPPETSPDTDSAGQSAEPPGLLFQPTLLTKSELSEAIYNSLSDSERGSLQHVADAVDATLSGKRYWGPLTDDDLKVAETYSTLINPARWREFWYRTAARTAGFPKFKRLRDRGDEDDFRSAAVAWAQLDGFTRGVILEALEAIAEEDEALLNAHQETIERYPLLLGIDVAGDQQSESPLRAPRP